MTSKPKTMDVSELSDEEFARRGNAIFEEGVRPQVDVEREAHMFVAIDIETGDYEVDERELEATRRLLERRPEARGRIWFRRVGSESAHRLGGGLAKSATRWPRLKGGRWEGGTLRREELYGDMGR